MYLCTSRRKQMSAQTGVILELLGVLINKKSTAVDLCLFSLFNEFVPLYVSILLMYDLWCWD